MLGLVKKQCGWAERGSSGPVKHRDCGVVEKEVLFRVALVTLKAKSENEGSHSKSEARSFAEKKIL